MNITINGEEKSKNEIVYNNVIESMEEMKLSKDDQINYLKTKVTNLEIDIKNKICLGSIITAGLIGLCLGLYFVANNFYLFGTVLSLGTFALMTYKLYITFKGLGEDKVNENYDKIEHLRKILNMRLK